jgi:hypothetical protein
MREKRYYIILNTRDIDTVDFAETSCKNADNLRLNNNATKCIISYRGRQPESLDGKTEYTHAHIVNVIGGDSSEWYINPSRVEDGRWHAAIKNTLINYDRFSNWY